MILEQCKNLLETNATAIAHQVNCRGVMGAGVAKLIRSEIISDSQYEMYQNLCKAKTAYELMGHNKVMSVPQGRIMTYVVNMFAEDIPTGKGLDTDYKSLYLCLQELEKWCRDNHIMHAAIPGYLGCGLAGGDWETVYSKILIPLFSKSCFTLTILYLPDSIRRLWTEFGDIPMDLETECIEQSWHGFPAGTHREEIWHWFEETFQISVAEALMYANNKKKIMR